MVHRNKNAYRCCTVVVALAVLVAALVGGEFVVEAVVVDVEVVDVVVVVLIAVGIFLVVFDNASQHLQLSMQKVVLVFVMVAAVARGILDIVNHIGTPARCFHDRY